MTQGQLFLFDDSLFAHVEDKCLVARFKDFHLSNPHVYRGLRDLAIKMRRTGRKRYGIKGLFEVLRWETSLRTTDSEFKLNNSYTSFYARLLMAAEHELAGFFSTRRSVADEQ